LEIDAPAQLISNIVPFHERAAKSISPSPRILRPSEICIKFSVRHWAQTIVAKVPRQVRAARPSRAAGSLTGFLALLLSARCGHVST
jgi:hypothetical protein